MIRLCTYFLPKVVDVSMTFVWDVTGKINGISFAYDSSISFPTSDVLRIKNAGKVLKATCLTLILPLGTDVCVLASSSDFE